MHFVSLLSLSMYNNNNHGSIFSGDTINLIANLNLFCSRALAILSHYLC